MIALQRLYDYMETGPLAPWLDILPQQIEAAFDERRNGNLPRWREALAELPPLSPGSYDLNAEVVRIGEPGDCTDETRARLERCLRGLHPWRKGPYELFGITIDTEWRSDMKWERLKEQIQPLHGRLVLDVGCGSGYHLWRMLGAGAARVIGIDPSLLFTLQFDTLHRFIPTAPAHVLPLALEALPEGLGAFDTVFSMGVLYHRRSPIDHLLKLRSCLRPGGELVLETLVVEGDAQTVLMPGERYAQMRNVWFIPSPAQLSLWLERCGFRNIRIADISRTTTEEQRATDWMRFESLDSFLNADDPTLTVEGYPAPTRAILLADAP